MKEYRFIVFLLDQSALMSHNDSQKAEEIVHSAILEILHGLVYGSEVRDRTYITIIGYGKKSLCYMWLNSWKYDRRVNLTQLKIVNITKGVPDNMEKVRNSALEIMNMLTPIYMGNVLLFNAQISDDNTDIIFPVNRDILKGSSGRDFLFDISSELTFDMIHCAKSKHLGFAQIGSKGFVLNNIHTISFLMRDRYYWN